MNCGKGLGGDKIDEFGICPAAKTNGYNGINRGEFAGRFCWAVAGTYCDGGIQGTFGYKFMDCMYCKFFLLVSKEEDREFIIAPK